MITSSVLIERLLARMALRAGDDCSLLSMRLAVAAKDRARRRAPQRVFQERMSGRFGDLDDALGDTRADVREGLEGLRQVAARRGTAGPSSGRGRCGDGPSGKRGRLS